MRAASIVICGRFWQAATAEVDWLLCAGLNRLKDLLSKDITDTKDKIHVRSPPAKRKLHDHEC